MVMTGRWHTCQANLKFYVRHLGMYYKIAKPQKLCMDRGVILTSFSNEFLLVIEIRPRSSDQPNLSIKYTILTNCEVLEK
jgi:hypothetical protein